jgi:hypothetical protein
MLANPKNTLSQFGQNLKMTFQIGKKAFKKMNFQLYYVRWFRKLDAYNSSNKFWTKPI